MALNPAWLDAVERVSLHHVNRTQQHVQVSTRGRTLSGPARIQQALFERDHQRTRCKR